MYNMTNNDKLGLTDSMSNKELQRYKDIYDRERRDYIYSIFKRVEMTYKGKNDKLPVLLKPLDLPYEFYSTAYVKYLHVYGDEHIKRFGRRFNPISIFDLKDALELLKDKHPTLIQKKSELRRLYRMMGFISDSDLAEKILWKGALWYTGQINAKANLLIENKDLGYVGPYRYKTWDCYDFITALLYATEYDIDRILDVKKHGWKTTDTIFSYGYSWVHASFGPHNPGNLNIGTILYAEKCSPNNGRHDHWGIVIKLNNDGYKVLNRSGGNWPRVDDLDFFYRYSNKKNGKVIHEYYPRVKMFEKPKSGPITLTDDEIDEMAGILKNWEE